MKRIALCLGISLLFASQSQACGLLRGLFCGGRQMTTRPQQCTPVQSPAPQYQSIPSSQSFPSHQSPGVIVVPASGSSCPNGQCPRVPSASPSGFRLSSELNLGGRSLGVSFSVAGNLLGLHNAERAQRGLPALVEDPQLTAAAQAQADAQAASGRMHHASRLTGSAENVAAGQRSESEVTRDWMNSPGHRRNILDGSFTRMGIGRNGNFWAVQFGR
jgi:uncharacterized protein YkwD